MCAAKTELPAEHWVQLTDFQASPKFPQRAGSVSPERSSDEAGDVLTELPPSTFFYESQHTPDPSSCSNSTTDELIKHHSRRSSLSVDTSGYSSRPDSPSKSPLDLASSRDVEVVSSKGSRKFYVTAKDATVLGRISHKAVAKRSTRVMEAHELFVELEELRSSSSDGRASLEWEETARWIKFEEDVEDSAGRWGRPHVSALTFHSLVELRKGLEQGSVMLGLEGDSFPDIVDRIVDQMVADEQLPQDRVDPVQQALYKRHRHQHQVTLWDDMKKAARSADGTLHQLGDQLRNRYHHGSHSHLAEMKTELGEETNGSCEQEKHHEENDSNDNTKQNGGSHIKLSSSVQELLDKIPEGAESITVLVGGVDFLKEPVVVFVRLAQSHLLGDLTEVPIPVRFLYLLLGPEHMLNYHEIGRAMATLMSDKCFHDMAYSALSREELLDAMDQFLDDSIVLPPGDWDQDLILPLMHERTERKRKKERWLELQQDSEEEHDPTRCSRRPFGGLWHDMKQLVRRYPSDIKDVLHIQCFLSMFFIFISCVAPAIAFGGLMEEVTHNQIGETETLVGTGLCGIVFSLLGVQPLAIIAFTGPLLLFEEIIIEFAELLNIEYLSWRACIGLWLMLMIIAFAITETTFLVKHFSRFSEEIFSGVIALFFTVEAGRNLVNIYWRNPLCGVNYPCGEFANRTNNCLYIVDDTNGSGAGMEEMMNATVPQGFLICNQPNTALWSTILCLSTFAIAVILRKLRQSRLLGKQARRLVSDFGMLTAISTMVVVSVLLRNAIAIETIVVSENFQLTNSTARNWIINPVFNLSVAEIIGAVVPAALLGILVFIENQLTLLLVNRPDHKLKKGVGYHFDLLIIGILAGVCGVMGLPWHCAAAIRSIQHVQSLSVYSNKNAPGEKPRLIHIHEQRITNLVVHILIILTPFAAIVLREIPFSVLLGVFLYLMYASFSGIQLTKRIRLLFTPPKHHPDIHYVRKVKTWKMNIYTVIQVVLISLLYGLKLSPAGMLYPVAIVLLVPIRMFMEKFMYTHKEFEALNGEEDHPDDYEADDIDFPEYQETHVPY